MQWVCVKQGLSTISLADVALPGRPLIIIIIIIIIIITTITSAKERGYVFYLCLSLCLFVCPQD